VNFAAGRFDLLDQRLEFGPVAAARKDGETFGGEFLGNLAADVVTGADHGHRRVSLGQVCLRRLNRV